MNKNNSSENKIYYILITIEILAIIIICIWLFGYSNKDYFTINDITNNDITNNDISNYKTEIDEWNNPVYERDRTRLYGSLFLDNLNKQIKFMTDPPIQYNNKRIDIVKYSDVLL